MTINKNKLATESLGTFWNVIAWPFPQVTLDETSKQNMHFDFMQPHLRNTAFRVQGLGNSRVTMWTYLVAREALLPLPYRSMTDDTTPATKADIQALMDSIGKLYDANERWKDEILVANERWKDEIIQHFGVAVEHLRHDLIGIHRDKISLLDDRSKAHEGRIFRLESRLGI